MTTGTINLNDRELKQAQNELKAIKRYFKGHFPIECDFGYNIRGPLSLSMHEFNPYGSGGYAKYYSGEDKQVFWLYAKVIEQELYLADAERQESDMRKLILKILSDSNEEIGMRSTSNRMIAKRASQILSLVAKQPVSKIGKVELLEF